MDNPTETIKVLIVDDHQVVRQGLRTFLELHEDILVVGRPGMVKPRLPWPASFLLM